MTIPFRFIYIEQLSWIFRSKLHEARRNCVALKDASVCTLVGRKRFSLQPAYIPTSIPIPTLLYTRLSSRNSAVHFYYLPFYGRKSLPHADSRCAEGRRAIAREGEGSFSKNEPAPSYRHDDEAGTRTCF